MKYLSKSFSTPANSRAYVENWESVFGDEQRYPCQRSESVTCPGGDGDPRNCESPRPWQCLCHAYMAGECMCGAWDDAR